MENRLTDMTLEELSALIEAHPWFAPARSVLASRLAMLGALDEETIADTAAYIGDNSVLRSIFLGKGKHEDEDASTIVIPAEEESQTPPPSSRKIIRVAGSDYFSQEEYDKLKEDETGLHKKIEFRTQPKTITPAVPSGTDDLQYYTETLAQIYADQEYYEQAIQIYSKLILAYPEKSAYFAALIDRIKENIKN